MRERATRERKGSRGAGGGAAGGPALEHWGSGRRASGKQEASGGARFLGSMRMQGLQEVLAGDPYGGGREAAREAEEVAGSGDEWIEGKVWLVGSCLL